MRCPSCKESNKDKVIDSRMTDGGNIVRRRRQCQTCGRRFTTKERVEEELRLTVIKRDGERVPYDREKIIRGLTFACYKLPIDSEDLQHLVGDVEEDIFRDHDREVQSADIGEYLIRRLRDLNSVAYVRFMSVYRKYSDVAEFIEEIQKVKDFVATNIPEQGALFDE